MDITIIIKNLKEVMDKIFAKKSDVPTKTSDLVNDSNFLTSHQDISGKANASDLSTVATTGSYNDLANKPTIPTKTSDLTNDNNYIQPSNFAWQKIASLHNDSIVLYANDFLCYVRIYYSTSQTTGTDINLTKGSDYYIWREFVPSAYRPSNTVTAVSEQGSMGKEVLIKITSDGSVLARSLADDYGLGPAIIECTLLWAKNMS